MSWPCHHCQMIADIERNKIMNMLIDDVKHVLELLDNPAVDREEISNYIRDYLVKGDV